MYGCMSRDAWLYDTVNAIFNPYPSIKFVDSSADSNYTDEIKNDQESANFYNSLS